MCMRSALHARVCNMRPTQCIACMCMCIRACVRMLCMMCVQGHLCVCVCVLLICRHTCMCTHVVYDVCARASVCVRVCFAQMQACAVGITKCDASGGITRHGYMHARTHMHTCKHTHTHNRLT